MSGVGSRIEHRGQNDTAWLMVQIDSSEIQLLRNVLGIEAFIGAVNSHDAWLMDS